MAKAKDSKKARRAAAKNRRGERRLTGLGVSPGIAVGRAHVRESGTPEVPEYTIPKSAITKEQARFERAVATSHRQVERLKAKTTSLPPAAAEEMGFLLEAHGQMLSGSRLIRGVAERIANDAINAEAAVQAAISEIAHGFAAMEDAYLAARIDDIREVGARLIRNLTDSPYQAFSQVPAGHKQFALFDRGANIGQDLLDQCGDFRGYDRPIGGQYCRRGSQLPLYT